MNARFQTIAAAALAVATAVGAEPGQPTRETPQGNGQSPRLVLASADQAQTPSAADQSSSNTPKRPRVARVTSCRCGDPQVQAEQEQ